MLGQDLEAELLWGELWVKQSDSTSWRQTLAWGRRDVVQRLLSVGAGHVPEAADLQYLGVTTSHARQLHEAEGDAIYWGAFCCRVEGAKPFDWGI